MTTLKRLLYHAVMLAISAIFLLPFYWMAISAFKNNAEIFSSPVSWFPDPICWDNIPALLTREDFPFIRQFLNSVFYAGSVAVLVVFSCSLAAYSFACLRWRGRDLVFCLTVAALLMPSIVTFLPVYLAWSKLGLTGTYWPLISPFLFGDAFFIFMLRQFFLGVPRELMDAARLDGASEFRIWWQIVLPQVRTALVIVGLFALVYTWNEFFGPLIYLQDRQDFPLSLGLFTFQSQRAAEWSAAMLQITPLLPRKPAAMSGGQRQRVAIGRAIVRQPEVFLFDEPLSNLDAALRVDMRSQIARLHHDLGATMIFVTHDQVEAMTLADRIVVLNGGRVEQVGSPRQVYHHPANLFVAGFIGSPAMNLMPGRLTGQGIVLDSGPVLPGPTGQGEAVTLGVRPDHVVLAGADAAHAIGRATLVEHLGGETILHLRTEAGAVLTVKLAGDSDIRIGDAVPVRLNLAGACLFGADGLARGHL